METPQVLLDHHLKALRLPTFLREYDKVARVCAAEQTQHRNLAVNGRVRQCVVAPHALHSGIKTNHAGQPQIFHAGVEGEATAHAEPHCEYGLWFGRQ